MQQKTRINSWATVTTRMANNVAFGLGLALDRYARYDVKGALWFRKQALLLPWAVQGELKREKKTSHTSMPVTAPVLTIASQSTGTARKD